MCIEGLGKEGSVAALEKQVISADMLSQGERATCQRRQGDVDSPRLRKPAL